MFVYRNSATTIDEVRLLATAIFRSVVVNAKDLLNKGEIATVFVYFTSPLIYAHRRGFSETERLLEAQWEVTISAKTLLRLDYAGISFDSLRRESLACAASYKVWEEGTWIGPRPKDPPC